MLHMSAIYQSFACMAQCYVCKQVSMLDCGMYKLIEHNAMCIWHMICLCMCYVDIVAI